MQDLIHQAKCGDREAFEALAEASVDRLYAIAYRILRDTDLASDAVQTALLAAWRDLGQLRDDARFDAWLYRLLIRACHRTARSERTFRANVRLISVEPSEEDETAAVADRDLVRRAFARLPVDQRAVVVLHYYAGLELVDVASALAIPAGTARSRLHHALRRLRMVVGATEPAGSKERTA